MREIADVWIYLPLHTDDGHPTRLVIFEAVAKWISLFCLLRC